MKCMTCNECSDKEYCAILNGLSAAPFPLVAYPIKGCHESNKEELKRIKDSNFLKEAVIEFRNRECKKIKLIEE